MQILRRIGVSLAVVLFSIFLTNVSANASTTDQLDSIPDTAVAPTDNNTLPSEYQLKFYGTLNGKENQDVTELMKQTDATKPHYSSEMLTVRLKITNYDFSNSMSGFVQAVTGSVDLQGPINIVNGSGQKIVNSDLGIDSSTTQYVDRNSDSLRYYESEVPDFSKMKSARTTMMTIPARKSLTITYTVKAQPGSVGKEPIDTQFGLGLRATFNGSALLAKRENANWYAQTPLNENQTKGTVLVKFYDTDGNEIQDKALPDIQLKGTLIPSSVFVGAADSKYHAVFRVDTSPLLKAGTLPGKYRLATDLPSALYLVSQQSAGRGRMFGTIATAGAGKLSDDAVYPNLDIVDRSTDVSNLWQRKLYPFGANLELYQKFNNTDTKTDVGNPTSEQLYHSYDGSFSLPTWTDQQPSADAETYGDITLMLKEDAVSGKITFVDQAGNPVKDAKTGDPYTDTFSNRGPGEAVQAAEITPPHGYEVDATAKLPKYPVTDGGTIKIPIRRITDGEYVSPDSLNPNSDGTVSEAQEATTAADAGLLANGLQLEHVPSFAYSGAITASKNVQLKSDSALRFKSIHNVAFSLWMTASAMTDGQTKNALPISSLQMPFNGDAKQGMVNVYQAGQAGNGKAALMQYGTKVASVSAGEDKNDYGLTNTSTLQVGDMTAQMDHGPKAGSYHGVVTYMAVEDDLN